MFRKTIVPLLSLAAVVAPLATVTPAQADDGGAVAAGAIIGLATGTILGSALSQPHDYEPAPPPPPGYDAPPPPRVDYAPPPPPRCYMTPIQKWDPYAHQYVTVGQRRMCD